MGGHEVDKSRIVMDVMPENSEIKIEDIEKRVRALEKDGLLWGTSEVEEVAFGIKKLRIVCVIENKKVPSIQDVIDELSKEHNSYIQSIEIVSFNKL